MESTDTKTYRAFLERVTEPFRSQIRRHPRSQELYAQALKRSKEQWPGIQVPEEEVARYWADRLPPDCSVEAVFGCFRFEDLYLACACGQKDPIALDHFLKVHAGGIDLAVMRLGLSSSHAQDIRQRLLQTILVGTPEVPAKITQFLGDGSIHNWIRVAAVREALKLIKRYEKEKPVEDTSLMQLVVEQADQEKVYMSTMYEDEFREAFNSAFAALTLKERLLLRQHLLDGLTFEQIGHLYKVNRSTISRWVEKIRNKLLVKTRSTLMHQLKVDQQEFNSIVRLLKSQLDFSVTRLLRGPPGASDKKP